MSGYVKGLLVTVVACRLVLLLAPNFFAEMKAYMKYLCGLVILLTVIMPFVNGCDLQEGAKEEILAFFTPAEYKEDEKTTVEEAVIEGTVRETAYAIMTYLSETYNIPADSITVTVVTEEEETSAICEIQIYLYNVSLSDRGSIRREIEEMTGIYSFVFAKSEK